MTAYQSKAQEIIKESIKSAIFIDEKAWMPYEEEQLKTAEEALSKELFNSFKKQNISLAVHKFNKSDNNGIYEDYFFKGRDLVLLDWKLDGETGEEYALDLLAKVINNPHIHFCCIYTFDNNLDNVLDNVLAYFSNENEEGFNKIKEDLEDLETEIAKLSTEIKELSYHRHDRDKAKEIKKKLTSDKEKRDIIKQITTRIDKDNIDYSLIKANLAFSNHFKSTQKLPCPELIIPDQNIIVIKNTIVLLLNKEYNTDPNELIQKITNQISNSEQSFTQLLGLEMQNLIESKGAFIDKNLIEVSRKTLLKHRKQTLESDLRTDLPFKDLVKSILFEHLKTGLSIESLSILDDSILEELSLDLEGEVSSFELIKLNTFYNSNQLDKEGKTINFGDVFMHQEGNMKNYYVCITALCDCLRPAKINNSFYFAKGKEIKSPEIALKLGDTAFISYLPDNKIVSWSEIETSDSEAAKYKPVYIKPVQIKILDNSIKEQQIETRHISDDGINIIVTPWKYVTTIKPNYTQRIANHAFAHPVRVGVDFVKK